MEDRAERLALYIIENRTTVRAAAQKFGMLADYLSSGIKSVSVAKRPF